MKSEINDIHGGRYAGVPNEAKLWMIGYNTDDGLEPRWSLIRLSDGRVTNYVSKERLAESLNLLGFVVDAQG